MWAASNAAKSITSLASGNKLLSSVLTNKVFFTPVLTALFKVELLLSLDGANFMKK